MKIILSPGESIWFIAEDDIRSVRNKNPEQEIEVAFSTLPIFSTMAQADSYKKVMKQV